jgi:hypothetical protein
MVALRDRLLSLTLVRASLLLFLLPVRPPIVDVFQKLLSSSEELNNGLIQRSPSPFNTLWTNLNKRSTILAMLEHYSVHH